jgi:hypothetical protein
MALRANLDDIESPDEDLNTAERKWTRRVALDCTPDELVETSWEYQPDSFLAEDGAGFPTWG